MRRFGLLLGVLLLSAAVLVLPVSVRADEAGVPCGVEAKDPGGEVVCIGIPVFPFISCVTVCL